MLFVLAIVLTYLLPTFVAVSRRVPHVALVAVINVLLGWTIVGWVIALIFACVRDQVNAPAPPVKVPRASGGELPSLPDPVSMALGRTPEDWGEWPAPHYDDYNDCQCPDHRAMRFAARNEW